MTRVAAWAVGLAVAASLVAAAGGCGSKQQMVAPADEAVAPAAPAPQPAPEEEPPLQDAGPTDSVPAEPDRPLAPPPARAEALEDSTGDAGGPSVDPLGTVPADPGTGAADEPAESDAPPAGPGDDPDGQEPAGERSLADIVEDVGRAVVKVRVEACDGRGSGSGFVIAPRLIATAEHVVSGAVSIEIMHRGVCGAGSRMDRGNLVSGVPCFSGTRGLGSDTDRPLLPSRQHLE